MKTNTGIYKIINIENKKVYVGSSVNLKSRKYEHYRNLKNNKHCNTYLQRAYNKYGKDNFKWEVLEYVEYNEDKSMLKKNLLEREQHWINFLDVCDRKKGYNILTNAGSNLGMKVSEETKNKMRVFMSGNKYSLGNILSEDTKRMISENHSRHNIKRVVNLTTGNIFDSITDASRYYGISENHISSVCKGKRQTTGGYKWAYVTDSGSINKTPDVCFEHKGRMEATKVSEIRNSTLSSEELAIKYEVHKITIDRIRGNKTWKNGKDYKLKELMADELSR